jgi:RNA 2',3'-cyclic 3'-phosphodiesterase
VRLFIALTLPELVTERLVREQQRLAAIGLQYRWTRRDALHLTLVFLGETPEAQVCPIQGALDEAAACVAPIALTADGIGVFPTRGTPRVVWAGVGGDRARLFSLHDALTQSLADRKFRVEDRRFSPHITLGRREGRVTSDARAQLRNIERYAVVLKALGSWTADAVHLVASQLLPDGARYTTLYTSALKR